MNKSILIVGGAGFLGQSLFKTLSRNNSYNLACADIVDTKFENVESININILEADSNIDECISRFDYIINLIGQITNPISGCLVLNTNGIRNLINAVKKFKKKLIHISTVTVYGSTEFADENTPLKPDTVYSSCKAFAEYLITSELLQSQYCILRISNLYGEGQTKGVFNYLLKSYQTDRKLNFNNNGDLVRYYLHIDDCSDRIIAAINNFEKKSYGLYNVLGNEKLSIKGLVHIFEELTLAKFETIYEDIAPYDNTLNISEERFQDFLPMKYNHTIKETLEIKLNN